MERNCSMTWRDDDCWYTTSPHGSGRSCCFGPVGCTLLAIGLPRASTHSPGGADRNWKFFTASHPAPTADTPIVIVIPGAKRNAAEYRDEWDHLAVANRFISLVIGAKKNRFPSEYEYNLGGVINTDGEWQPTDKWLFSAVDKVFDDFRERFGSSRQKYSLYGHSAGGGFVNLFMLFMPNAKVNRAVAANAPFYTMPDPSKAFPFGLRGAPLAADATSNWFSKPIVYLLGDRDTDPRTQPISNGAEAQLQGPHGFARGLDFFQESLVTANRLNTPFKWRLEIVPYVGHSDAHMASHAVKYLLVE